MGYCSIYNSVPLLMAIGIAAVGSFMAYKSWRMLRDANVRGPFRQLKRDRRITPAGYAFFAATLAVLALGDIPAGVTILRQGLVQRPTSTNL